MTGMSENFRFRANHAGVGLSRAPGSERTMDDAPQGDASFRRTQWPDLDRGGLPDVQAVGRRIPRPGTRSRALRIPGLLANQYQITETAREEPSGCWAIGIPLG